MSYRHLFREFKILSVSNIYKYKVGLLFYIALNYENYDPVLCNHIVSNTGEHSYAARNRLDITLPLFRKSRTQNSLL